jgi:hypothetical protein
LFPVSW